MPGRKLPALVKLPLSIQEINNPTRSWLKIPISLKAPQGAKWPGFDS